MSAVPAVALLLAVAALTAPAPARLRLGMRAGNPRRAGWVAVVPTTSAGAAVALVASPALTCTSVIAGLVIWVRRRRRHRDRRRLAEGQAMAGALEVLIGELRVGAHPARAFAIAASESEGAVSASLGAVATRALLGADVASGLRTMAAGSSVPAYWDRLAACWQLAAEHGLAMSTLMQAAHGDIVGRQRFADRIRAALAGARATAAILAGLPVIGVLLGELIGAHPIRFLLEDRVGGWLLAVGVTLVCAGVAWSDHIIDRLVA